MDEDQAVAVQGGDQLAAVHENRHFEFRCSFDVFEYHVADLDFGTDPVWTASSPGCRSGQLDPDAIISIGQSAVLDDYTLDTLLVRILPQTSDADTVSGPTSHVCYSNLFWTVIWLDFPMWIPSVFGLSAGA
uniref:Putative exopolygalacturonase n=1 Tax=Linum usitatissimum TaxID=4006 RepID=A0A172MLF7_LINUS|nr:putative exopolygalacturonase [Linum usitatissimum]